MPNSNPNFLNRWLDRNPKGPLTRTRNFITIPPFNIPSEWIGFSDIVGIFDYTASHNFTIRDYSNLVSGASYTLMISYVNADHSVKRYRLVAGNEEVIFLDIPQYDGEVIKKLFRVEVWNTAIVGAVQLDSRVMVTSVLNDQDYRYGADTELDSNVILSTDFLSILGPGIISAQPSLVGLDMWFDSSGIVTGAQVPNILGQGGENILGQGGEPLLGQ